MEGITLIGAFGATIIGLGVAEKLGVKVNFEAVKLVVTIAGYGAMFYLIKMVAAMLMPLVSGVFLFWSKGEWVEYLIS